jgi:hypothetical protein
MLKTVWGISPQKDFRSASVGRYGIGLPPVLRALFLPNSRNVTHPSDLKRLLATRFPESAAMRPRQYLPTGLPSLDDALSGGGLAVGEISEWTGAGGSAVAAAIAWHVVQSGQACVWVDAGGRLAQSPPAGLLVRTVEGHEGAGAAEILAGCGAFALVVVSGAVLNAAECARIALAARSGRTAVLCVGRAAARCSLRVVSWLDIELGPGGVFTSAVTIRVSIRSGGTEQTLHIPAITASHALRISLESDLADRRGDTDAA